MRTPLPCPVCAALVHDDTAHIAQHTTWHEQTRTLGPRGGDYHTANGLRAGFRAMRAAVELVDDAPTQRMAPVRDTVLRRPPAPEVRQLAGRDLLLALAEELRAYDEDDQP